MILKAVPGANESIKWGTPVYENNGPVCFLCKGKGFIALQFGSIGTSLKDPDGLLEGTGKKMRHVKIRPGEDIRKQEFTSWVKAAASANH